MAAEYIVRLPLESPSPPSQQKEIILCTEWLPDDLINFRVFSFADPQQALLGSVNLAALRQRAEEFEIPVDEFLRQTKECLTTDNGLKGFQYHQKWDNDDDPQSCQFSWKKKGTGTLTLVYGTVQLNADNNNGSSSSSSNGLIATFERLQKQNRLLEEENEKLRKDQTELKLCYEKMEQAAKETEIMILSKCRLLINSKKERIQELELQLKQQSQQSKQPVESQDSETPFMIVPSESSKKRKAVNKIFSESSQQDESSSDDDDSLPLCQLAKRNDLLRRKTEEEEQKVVNIPPVQQDTQVVDVAAADNDSQDCNGLFDEM